MDFLWRGEYLFAVVCFLVVLFQTGPYLHIYQLEGYNLSLIYKNKNLKQIFFLDCIVGTIFLVLWTIFLFVQSRIFWGFLLGIFFFVCEFGIHFTTERVAKKPLRYTKRAVRLIILNSLVISGVVLGLLAFSNCYFGDSYFRYLAFFFYPFLFPILFLFSALAILPFEKLNHLRYENATIKTLESHPELIKIAITGSYGKTSVKNYLTAMLKDNFCVLTTKESYNTPMGISKTVKDLTALHEVFIAEMGARKVGDIKRLMEIVKPTHSILTGITSQHLETFKSIENIIQEKELVVSMLDESGIAVANGECEYISLERENVLYGGFSEDCDCYADNVICSKNGSVFYLHVGGDSAVCATPLLGKHNILNIVLAATMATQLGVSLATIVKAVATLEPVAHRQQLVEGNGITIIDDSFNSSIVGSRAALDTLSLFSGRKIVLTPGLIELGEKEEEENIELGKAIAKVADFVILIGEKRSQPLLSGLIAEEFERKNVMTFKSLADAQENFPKLLHLSDTLLILNDLPDNYDE